MIALNLSEELPSAARLVIVALAAAAAGVMNSIAGGGTLLTFPALVGLGVPPVVANATSTVALLPGAFGSLWGYRRELQGATRLAVRLAIPSVLGGLIGAFLLLRTEPATFSALAPWLVLGATLLFVLQAPVLRWIRRRSFSGLPGVPHSDAGGIPQSSAEAPDIPQSTAGESDARPSAFVLLFQFFIAVYGGYFGAGIGILMLAALGMAGLTNIHRMNGLKNWAGMCINFVAAAAFAASGLVNWPVALAMGVGATAGGYAGSGMAQRVSQATVRRAIAAIGFGSALWLLTRPV